MKQLGNLATVCAGRPDMLLQIYDGYACVYHTFLYIDSIGRFVERYVLPPAEWMLLGSGAIIKRKWIDSIMDRLGKIPYNPRVFRSLSPSANAIRSHIFKAEVMEIYRRENLY